MNKFIKIFAALLIFCIAILGCNSAKTNIQVNQIDTEHPILLKYSKKYNKFSRIGIPIKVKIKNNSFKGYSFASIRYKYNSKLGGISEKIYKEYNQNLIEIINNKKKSIKPNSHLEYVIYTSHRLDSADKFQEHFKQYLPLIRNNDTLDIGSIKHFKQTNSYLLNILTKNDSISVNSWKKKDIIIPVEW